MNIARIGFLALLASGCGPGAIGNVAFTTAGNASITDSIPADSATKAGFVDGWSVTFKRFLVIIKELTIADATGKVIFKQPNGLLYDLKRTGPFSVQDATGLSAKKYDKVSYAIGFDPYFQIVDMNAASIPDAELMKNNSFGLYIEGTATKGTSSKSFQWGFSLDTLYQDCTSDQGAGVTVTNGGTAQVELTVHADHLFLDNLASETSKLRFEALANADTPVDGTITLDELNAVMVSADYGVGTATDVKTLRDFIFASSRNIGHYRGDGECTITAR